MWIFVSGRSRSSRRKCVGRVLRAESPVPQGVSASFLDIFRFPACRPQDRSWSSTEIGPSSTGSGPPCGVRVLRAARLCPVRRCRGLGHERHQAPEARRLSRRTPPHFRPGRKWEKGPHRYELQGPFRWGAPRASPWPSPSTGTGDAPDRSSRLLRPRRPRHLASAAPLPASWAATVWIFVSGRSRSPRRECVRRVLGPGGPGPQGLSDTFFRHTRSSGVSSTAGPGLIHRSTRLLHSSVDGLWTAGWTSRLSDPWPRRPPRPPAAADRHRTARRSGPPPAGRRWSCRRAPRSPDTR